MLMGCILLYNLLHRLTQTCVNAFLTIKRLNHAMGEMFRSTDSELILQWSQLCSAFMGFKAAYAGSIYNKPPLHARIFNVVHMNDNNHSYAQKTCNYCHNNTIVVSIKLCQSKILYCTVNFYIIANNMLHQGVTKPLQQRKKYHPSCLI